MMAAKKKLPPGTRYYESLQKDKAYCLNCTIEKRCCKKMNNSLAEIAFWSFNKKEISKLKACLTLMLPKLFI